MLRGELSSTQCVLTSHSTNGGWVNKGMVATDAPSPLPMVRGKAGCVSEWKLKEGMAAIFAYFPTHSLILTLGSCGGGNGEEEPG